ncbi:MAG: nucleotidyltransferase domain-containing protein [Bacteroidetes bacterium]|nr:nucleotidyltransferase domain-containing protein [Bacteroidota bacterium]
MENKIEVLEIIKTTARVHIADAEVMLFGSRARKDSTAESDFDILIITNIDFSPKEKLPLKTSIRKDLLRSGIRSDILIQSRKEVKMKKKLPGHIIKNILKEAILL